MLITQKFPDKAVGVPATKAIYGEKIKALRMAEGMSRSVLAKRISLSDRSIRFIETGDRKPSEYTLKKLPTFSVSQWIIFMIQPSQKKSLMIFAVLRKFIKNMK